MFNPNQRCVVYSNSKTDVYGRTVRGGGRSERCSVVKLVASAVKTSVRADSSSSRGAAQEVVSDAILLFLPSASIKIDDKVEIAGFSLRVSGVHPRFNVRGVHDHNEVHFEIWGE